MPTSAGWYPGARQSCTRLFGPSPKMSREHAVQAVLTWIWTQHKQAVEALGMTLEDMHKFCEGWPFAGRAEIHRQGQGRTDPEAAGPVSGARLDSLELAQLQASLWASRAEGRAKAEADEAGQARHTSFA